jgi:hypothetical protein
MRIFLILINSILLILAGMVSIDYITNSINNELSYSDYILNFTIFIYLWLNIIYLYFSKFTWFKKHINDDTKN